MYALIIDDSRAMRRILRQIVQPLGFDILEAGDGQEGLDQLSAHPDEIELTLVDWNMPVMNGLEFVKRVRSDAAYADMKLMMVTTETEPANQAEPERLGANPNISHPGRLGEASVIVRKRHQHVQRFHRACETSGLTPLEWRQRVTRPIF